VSGKWKYLDEHLRLRLSDLEPEMFEKFFLHFLRADVRLTIARNGQQITKRVISAETYATGRGRSQKGIDLRAVVEGGEEWVFQCKRHKTWSPAQTRKAIQEASKYQANHYFLVVACDPHEGVQDEMKKHPNWTFWNLDTICAEFRLRVHPSRHAEVLFFLPREELKRFVPFTTEALIPPEEFFKPFLGAGKLFRHDWKLVGRKKELDALLSFVSGTQKVQVVAAKGGDGKSRLLWGLCRELAVESPETQLLFLNPHLRGDLSFGLVGNPSRRLILVDDAHRTEQVPPQLLTLAREDASAKIVLATRPQGIESLFHKLYETGLANSIAPQISLAPLARSEAKMLAAEALGPKAATDEIAELARLTADCPFLTVIAGELLRQGRLRWGKWSSDGEFRGHVFREFEKKNFEIIPEGDRDAVRWLIRLLAMLAPVAIGPQFTETAARALGCTAVWVESHLNWLRESGLVAGRDDGLRIVPDLFADFLVYDTCYEPKTRMPAFARRILGEFGDCGAALLRNLSEATWIARANGVSDEELLKTLVDQEHRRFEAASFRERAQMLEHWSRFSVYLPAETLGLARRAVALKTAPKDTSPPLFASRERDSHDHVIDQVPALLKPVAKYHQEHRHAALDLLWELGSTRKWVDVRGSNHNHPWSTIAEVIRFEPKKQVSVTLEALEWLNNRLQRQDGLKVLEAKVPVLRALVGPCFDRIVEFTRREGRTVYFCHEAVLVENTQPIRDLALAVLASVIKRGSGLAVLDALSALELALWPANQAYARSGRVQIGFRERWRPERLKALALFEKCIAGRPGVAIRYQVRRTLKQVLMFEEDPVFAEECRRALTNVPNDLRLRTAVILLSTATDEFMEALDATKAPEKAERSEGQWNEMVRQGALELAASYPAPATLRDFLSQLTDELVQAGDQPFADSLFSTLAETAPVLARGLAEGIVEMKGDTPLVCAWPALVASKLQAGDAKRIELYRRGIQSPVASVSSSVIRALTSQASQNHPLSETEQGMVLEKAGNATASVEDATCLLHFVQCSGEANFPLALRILERLPLREVASRVLWQILDVLVPTPGRKLVMPQPIVRRVLLDLVDVPKLDFDRFGLKWDALTKAYPREIYELVCRRIAQANSGGTPDDYYPIPTDFRSRFRIPDLASEQDFARICDDLWQKASCRLGQNADWWVRLFQAVAFDGPPLWASWMQRDIEIASSEEDLLWLAWIIRFEGSLVVFRFPALTRALLSRAQTLGGRTAEKMRSALYAASGPQFRLYSQGALDGRLDYVQAEAVKAAQAHAEDEVLGPFYRWIAEVEQRDRLMHKLHAEAAMASLD
jgi:hypothetical protein